MKRKKTTRRVTRKKRVYRVVTVTKNVVQCEAPYVLFGAAVKKHRKELRLTQQSLADTIGVSRASIANIEIGRQRVLLGDVFVYAKALLLPPKKLFDAIQK